MKVVNEVIVLFNFEMISLDWPNILTVYNVLYETMFLYNGAYNVSCGWGI